jgi:hypothetical protein
MQPPKDNFRNVVCTEYTSDNGHVPHNKPTGVNKLHSTEFLTAARQLLPFICVTTRAINAETPGRYLFAAAKQQATRVV